MPTSKKHEKVEKLRAKRSADIAALYYNDATGRQMMRYATEVHAARLRAIEEEYDAALVALMEEAQVAADATDTILARTDNPYTWLAGAEEEARAARLAPLFQEDMSALDAAGVLQALETAAGSSDRVARWLTYRYAGQRWRVLDSDDATALGMVARAKYPRALDALRDGLLPPAQKKERDAAQKQLDDAKTLYEAAEWARPSVRQDFATRMGVPAEYLPE
jgi:hypothetical protein